MFSVIAGLGIAAATVAASIWNSSKDRESRENMLEELKRQGQVTQQDYDGIKKLIETYYDDRGSMGSRQDVDNYLADVRNWNADEYDYKFDKFGEGEWKYDKSKEDFLNPYYDAIIGDTADQIQHSAAGAGLGRGTGAALSIAKGVAQKSDELYKTALQEYNQDKQQAYKEYSDYITNMQNRYKQMQDADKFKLQLEGQLANDYYNVMDQKQADLVALEHDKLKAKTAYDTAMTGLG